MKARILLLTTLAMVAFASNSLLCRSALKHTGIDAATFTFVRIFSGAAALWLIITARKRISAATAVGDYRDDHSGAHRAPLQGNWWSALALFAYAAAFSFAYIDLAAGTGALLLFGAVQATMILWGFRKGERLDAIQIAGLLLAVAGLVVLVLPGVSAPPIGGSTLMLAAGAAWGIYSLRGKAAGNAIATTTGNFVRAVPFAAIVSIVLISHAQLNLLGVCYAAASGAITSGLGYVIWYSALPGLNATSAATVQLSVPVLAAGGGIIFLHEPITVRYVVASLAVLGGIFLVVIEKRQIRAGDSR